MANDAPTSEISKAAQSMVRATTVNIKASRTVHHSFVYEQQKRLNHDYQISFRDSAQLILADLEETGVDEKLVEKFTKMFIG